MKLRGPILTLAAIVVLALVLLLINLRNEPEPTASQAGGAAATSAPPATPTAAPEAFPAKAKYVGYATKKDGSQAAIAITVDGPNVKAYLCDGKAVEAWYQGKHEGGVLVDVKGKGNNKLEGKLEGGTLKGQVTVRVGTADVVWPYEAAEATSPTAGLYRASNAQQTTGWIVQANGTQTGLGEAADGTTVPATTLDPDNLGSAKSVDGTDNVLTP